MAYYDYYGQKQYSPYFMQKPEEAAPQVMQPEEATPYSISPYEGYTSNQVRGLVDKNLSNILGEKDLGSGFKVDTGSNYRSVDWQGKGFIAPETAPDYVPQIFWNPQTKEIAQLPSGGYTPPEGWQSYGGEYIDRINVPDFGVEPAKIRTERGSEIREPQEADGSKEITKWRTESVDPQWSAWKQQLDEFSASLPEVAEDTPEVPRGTTYDLAFDRSAAVNPDSMGSQLMQMFKDSGRRTRWNPASKDILIDDRPIYGVGDLRDLYMEDVGKTGRTLNVTPGMQAIDFYRNSLLGGSATSYYDLTATKRALASIDPDTSYLDAIVHNEQLRNDPSYKDTIEGNISDAVLLTQEYIQSVRDQIPEYSTATPWSGGRRFFESTERLRPTEAELREQEESTVAA